MTGYRQVEGVDNSPEAIESLRQYLVEHRKHAMGTWPEGIQYTVNMSHVIALLHELKAYKEAGVEIPEAKPEPVRRAAPPKRES